MMISKTKQIIYLVDEKELRMTQLKKIGKQILRVLRDFLILIALGNGLSLFMVPLDQWSFMVFIRNGMFSILMGYPTWKGIVFLVIVLDEKLPWLKYPVKRLIFQVSIMLIYVIVIVFIGFSIWIWLDKNMSFQTLNMMAFQGLKMGLLFMFFSMLIGNTVFFFKNWRQAAIHQEELKRAQITLQFQTLKNQIKPHFLFNSLNSLISLINNEPDKATQFVHKLSDVYRYVLEQSENELVDVSEEVKFLEDYIYLQKIRFGNSLEVNINIDLGRKSLVIPLSLQMIVENAIKHNMVSKEFPLAIYIYSTPENQVVIKNNLHVKDVIENSLGIGIENLKKRIAFFTDETLIIEEGTEEFIVKIPVIKS
ncbi:sensor histidine kinase [Bacteroidota bacterium]